MSTYQGRGRANAPAELEDIIIDGLTMEEAEQFEDVLIVVLTRKGGDFARVDMRMRLLMLTDDTIGLGRIADPGGQLCIDRVADLIRRDLDADRPTDEEWSTAGNDALAASRAAKVASAAIAAKVAFWAVVGHADIWCGTVDANAAQAVEAGRHPTMISPASEAIWRRIAGLFLAELAAAPSIDDHHAGEVA